MGLNPTKYLSALSYLKLFKDNFGSDEDDEGFLRGGKQRFSPTLKIIETDKAISLINEIITRDGHEKRLWTKPENNRWGGFERPERTNYGKATADKAEHIMLTKEEWDKVPVDQEFVDKFKKFANSLEIKPERKRRF